MYYLFSNDVCVNFQKVASIKKTPNRLVINFNYSIKKDNTEYADYLYIDNYNKTDLNIFENPWFKKNYIKIAGTFLNKHEISNIKYKNDKIIINVGVSKQHTFKTETGELINEVTSIFYYENAPKERFLEILSYLK